MPDHPALLLALVVTTYWTIVLIKSAHVRLRRNKSGALVPRLATERRIWPVWFLVVVGWHALPMLAARPTGNWFDLPEWARSSPIAETRLVAAAWSVVLLAATIHCWIAMGRAWSVAVIPGELKTLVTTGPFAIVRHPIYSLSIQLMLCSVVVVPTVAMVLVAATHITLMRLKVAIEEQALAAEFGPAWHAYSARTGRFLPQCKGRGLPLRQSPPAPRHLAAGQLQGTANSPAPVRAGRD